MKTNHTPGPWRIDYNGKDSADAVPRIKGNSVENVAFIPAYEHPRPEMQANARLIAAAPDLLGALEKCSALLDAVIVAGKCAAFADLTESPMGNIIDPASEARAAIAKATTPQS